MPNKACPHCGKIIEGHPNKKYCDSKCRENYRYHNNPERREYNKNRNQRDDVRERKQLSDKRYYETNKEQILQRNKVYREGLEPARINQSRREYDRRDPVRYKVQKRVEYANAKAKKLGIDGRLKYKPLWNLLDDHKWKCFYCGLQLDHETFSIDHKIAMARGGANHIDNIVPACLPCNKSKATKTPEEFIQR